MSKERLVNLLKEARCGKDCDGFKNAEFCNGCTAYEKSVKTADHLLANGEVIVLPCKVGDKVYEFVHGEILETEAVGFLVCQDGAILIITRNSFPLTREVGCCVFLTREEAEKVLEDKK